MNDSARKIDPSALFTGLVLIGIGAAFLLGDFGGMVRQWWPMFIVLLGVSRLLQRRTLWSGLWLLALGLWLQAVRLHLFDMTFRNAWPLLLIFIGAGIALRAVFDVAEKEERRES